MNRFCIFLLFGWLMVSCHSKKAAAPTQEEVNEFFPVTEFIQGQVAEIKINGLNPLKIVQQRKRADSSWIQADSIDRAFAEFTTPNIDSSSMGGYFNTKKFFDQTLNLITLSYDANEALPTAVPWKHWDVYIDPDKNMVTRLYLVKQLDEHTIQQLTWLTGKYARSVSIREDSTGQSSVLNETIIKWRY